MYSAPEENIFSISKNKDLGIPSSSFGPFDDKSRAAGASTASARSFDSTSGQPGSHSNDDGTMILDDTGPDNMFDEDPPPGYRDAMELDGAYRPRETM